ncbi:myb/SANT-like DNA-binding domain-containing protein 3 [Anoplophora glabripennis]|uniref:myb/SANT-like DNA-binding domain-containing protein 3 n=1 Tax=Anoplophora glabripennis TaxID=217634 RepID=UPI0008738B47|nr:myb/SANT-like DNA-binding domain-containing protein 3 [Anoplophora glabripennis]
MDYAESDNKKKRSANFTNNDKALLINIVSKFKHIVENKKTDAVTSREKTEAWKNITQQYNSSGPSCPRDVECLKRCYDNRKKLLRKSVAFERRELYKTGGGLPNIKENKEPGDDLLLSIVCDKVINGLDNHFDGDAIELDSDHPQPILSSTTKQGVCDDNIEIIYETDEENVTNLVQMTENKEKQSETFLKEKNFNEPDQQSGLQRNWKRYKIEDLKSYASDPLRPREVPSTSNTPHRSCDTTLSRRRPRTIVKSLTTSELSQKYNKLLDERIEIAQYQKQHYQNLIKFEMQEHELRVELLKTQIEKEKSGKT